MRTRPRKAAQRGLSAFGALLVIAIAVVAIYYVYQSATGEDTPKTCSTEFESCMTVCRRTTSDNEAAQACQNKCESDQAFCRTAAKRNK